MNDWPCFVLSHSIMNITLVPNAGLCNRLNCIASAVTYRRQHPDSTIRVFWHNSRDCRSRFSDLFESELGDGSLHIEELPSSRWLDIPASRHNLFLPQLTRRVYYDFQFTDQYNADDFEKTVQGFNKVYVCHCNRFWEDASPIHTMSDLFIPVKGIRESINMICKSFDNRKCIIGLHIRRTDNLQAIFHSPIEQFERVIEQKLETDSGTLFYLATDDLSVKKHLTEVYGNSVISPDFTLNRSSLDGMKDAVTDLFCLAKTNKIYGSFASTYSSFASQIYGVPLEICEL